MCFDKGIAIKIEHLSKVYKLYQSPGDRMRSLLTGKDRGTDFVALHDVSMEIEKGEAFAIIGKNGSGKSTMLQILAGILEPTKGSVQINGRVAALLELGSGFDPEYSGYENIYMNAAIYGLGKEAIEQKIQRIVEFADIGEHLYEPVKTYSSGMYMRLGFSVAINVDADILLIDEALAVGDVFFRQKCYTRLNELKESGTTIVLVTHNMGEASQFCNRGMLLKDGKCVDIGRCQIIVKEYYMMEPGSDDGQGIIIQRENEENHIETDRNDLNMEFLSGWKMKDQEFLDLGRSTEIFHGKMKINKIGLFDRLGNARYSFLQGETAFFYVETDVLEDIEVPLLGIVLFDQRNVIVHGKDTSQTDTELPKKVKKGKAIQWLQSIRLDFAEGEYSFEVGAASMRQETYQKRMYYNQEMLNDGMESCDIINRAGVLTVLLPQIGDPTRLRFHGIADVAGKTEVSVGGK